MRRCGSHSEGFHDASRTYVCPVCGHEIGGANPEWEEDRLRDAVVDAALAWGGPGWLGPSRMIDATAALRAHRAKKGGA